MRLGEDIICDLRQNNGCIPKYDAFWDIVVEYIQNKTAIDARRHSAEVDGEIVVTMAITTSYADMYRQRAKIVTSKNPPVDVPSKAWFVLQFWPSSRTLSNITHYAGRFKVKKMFQARLLWKKNPDSHYVNAVYSFLKERAVKHVTSTAMISDDAFVSRGKAVTVGKNETFKVGDHEFPKVSLIPDVILMHSIPEKEKQEEQENTECNKQSVGRWSIGKGIATQGSSALRGATEMMAMTSFYDTENVHPPPIFVL